VHIQQVPSQTTSPSPGSLKSPVRAVIFASRPLTSAALRSAVAESADIRIVGESASLYRLEELLATASPEALLLDGTDPLWDTFETLRRIRCHSGRRVGVVVLSDLESTDNALRYLRVGADALVRDDSALDDIANALRAVAQGHAVLPPPIARSVLDLMSVHLPAMPASRHLPDLTAREQEILQLITTGLSNQEVADQLVLSEKTVKFHVSNLLRKLGVRNRAQAIVYAHDHRLLGVG
jgi:two-component system, NarL family, response regulator LiaR